MKYDSENVVTASYYANENLLQAACFTWANNNYPQIRGLLWAVTNQKGTRSAREMQMLKSMGQRPGVHDLHLFYKGLFFTFELKMPGNYMTESQREWARLITDNGGICCQCVGAAEFIAAFKKAIHYAENRYH